MLSMNIVDCYKAESSSRPGLSDSRDGEEGEEWGPRAWPSSRGSSPRRSPWRRSSPPPASLATCLSTVSSSSCPCRPLRRRCSPWTWSQLSARERLALLEPSLPAIVRIAREYLTNIRVWRPLKDERRSEVLPTSAFLCHKDSGYISGVRSLIREIT